VAKNGSFGFVKGLLAYRAKTNVAFVRWHFILFCAVGKKLIQEAVGLCCRQIVCPMLVKQLSVCISVHCVKIVLSSFRVAGIDLHASYGRDTEALNCKPITNL
jgi:hypothetical protein